MNLVRRLLAAIVVIALTGCATQPRDSLVQYSTINALLAGIFEGDMTYGELRRHGDFGLGTFNAADGEMLALDGRYYQIRSDGHVVPVTDSMRTPFAVVTFFRVDRSLSLTNVSDFHTLERRLDEMLPATNAFYAIRIDGEFDFVKSRSVPRQSKPYRTLAEVSKEQSVFEFHNVRGTLVGFRIPNFMQNLNVPGYHFHFLSADLQAGGHVLDCSIRHATVQTDELNRFLMILPNSGAFQQTDLTQERRRDMEAVEKGEPSR